MYLVEIECSATSSPQGTLATYTILLPISEYKWIEMMEATGILTGTKIRGPMAATLETMSQLGLKGSNFLLDSR